MILVHVVAGKSTKSVMENNLGDDDLEEVNDLYVDPITGEVQSPETSVAPEGDLDSNDLSVDEPTDLTEALHQDDTEEISAVFDAAELNTEQISEPSDDDGTNFAATEHLEVGEAGTVMGDDPIGSPPPLPGLPEISEPASIEEDSSNKESDAEDDLPTAILADVSTDTEFVSPETIADARREMDEDAAAVDNFLESAVLALDTTVSDADESSGDSKVVDRSMAASAAIFQVSIRNAKTSKSQARILQIVEREALVKDLDSVKGRLEELGGYRFSHLREYQATVLMQELQQLDVECRLDIPSIDGDGDFPKHSTSLFQPADDEIHSTGAIAVELPNNSKEILLSTLEQISEHETIEEKGVLSAHSSVARSFFREDEQEARLVQKIDHLQSNDASRKELRLPRAEMDNVFEKLLYRLQREAMRRGANAVLGIQISGFPEANGIDPEADQIRLIANGTAVILRSIQFVEESE